ncbi:MAG: V-type ATPase subunit [Lachnospiraceae bacterium]|nr:V-type ATPase subunit [Lachnospiraceae bacterium]
MTDNEYIYAVARIRTKEMSLFDRQTLEQLLTCRTYEDCLKLLAEKGWGEGSDSSDSDILAAERKKTWDLMRELVDDMSVFDVFLYEKDYHNLKAAIKQALIPEIVPAIFTEEGTVPVSVIREAVNEKKFDLLPERMRACAEEGYEIQMQGRDSQMCDVVIDRAALDAIYGAGKASKTELFSDYAELKVAQADIQIAVRGARLKKNKSFYEKALAVCDTLDCDRLGDAALAGTEAVCEYLESTAYSDAVSAIKTSGSAFECWCDNRMMEKIQREKYHSFTVAPLAAYVLARENEIKSVRIILSGKRNQLPEEVVRERLREMYV